MTDFRTSNFTGGHWNNNTTYHELPYSCENKFNNVSNIPVFPNSFHQENNSANNVSGISQNLPSLIAENVAVINPFEVRNDAAVNAPLLSSCNPSKSLANEHPYPIADNESHNMKMNLSRTVPYAHHSNQSSFSSSNSPHQAPNIFNRNTNAPMNVRSIPPPSNDVYRHSIGNKVSPCTENNWHSFPNFSSVSRSNTVPMFPTPTLLPLNSNLPPVTNFSADANVKFNLNNINQFNTVSIPHQNFLIPNNSLGMMPPIQSNMYSFPPPVISPMCFSGSLSAATTFQSEKDRQLSHFLSKFKQKEKKSQENNLTIVKYRSAIQTGLSLLKALSESKNNLTAVLNSSEDEWNSHTKNVLQIQTQLTEICDMLSNPTNLSCIQKKLLNIKKKREYKKHRKIVLLSSKREAEENRKELNQKIDKCLDNIKEKNLDHKRKMEMKKEADSILSEVRRKIQEAKRTIEKLKAFEKLRNARHVNAMKKSLIIQPEHTENFVHKISVLKEVMVKQLSDYEAEENALKVILEAEQEGQLEEEALWRAKKIKTILQRKQKNITECLFGKSDEPNSTDPIFLFYSHHNSANSSISNLVQIRHHWDIYLSDDGESIPQQWVAPVPPSSALWEQFGTS